MSTASENTLEQSAEPSKHNNQEGSVENDNLDDMPWIDQGMGRWSKSDISIDSKSTNSEMGNLRSSPKKAITHSDHGNEGIDTNSHTHSTERDTNVNDRNTGNRLKITSIGLYIGKTRCGSAFSVKSEGKWSHIQMNQSWVNNFNIKVSTVPTALLYDKSGNVKFGCEAITEYHDASHPQEYNFQDNSTLLLRKSESDEQSPELVQFLSYIVVELRNNIEKQVKKYQGLSHKDDTETQWIVAYTDDIKSLSWHLLSEVLRSKNIDMIPEDEVAAIWCAEIPIHELANQQNQRNTCMDTHAVFGVLDIESEYLSIFEKTGVSSVKRVATQAFTFDLHKAYEKLFSEVFDRRRGKHITDYQNEHPRDWLSILTLMDTVMNNFNTKKEVVLSLPYTFNKSFDSGRTFESKSISINSDNKLVIKPDYFCDMFDMYAKQVSLYLSGLNASKNYEIKYLFLIGKAALLLNHIEHYVRDEKFPNIPEMEIKRPPDSNACALRGAVLAGMRSKSKNTKV